MLASELKQPLHIIRNQILISEVAKEVLPFHGLGSGSKRVLEKWLAIDFADNHDGCLFTAMVHRKSTRRRVSVGKTSGKIQDACREKPSITIPELAELIGITEAITRIERAQDYLEAA